MTKDTLAQALCSAQSKMQGAKKDKKNPFFKSSYADLSSVFEAIRGPFSENGIAITQTMDILESGKQVLVTTLMHASGETVSSRMLLPDIADPQKLGGAITYYRRYSLMAIAGIPAEDDDGNSASRAVAEASVQQAYITSEQVQTIESMLKEHEEVRATVYKSCSSLNAIPADKFDSAVQWIKRLIAENENG